MGKHIYKTCLFKLLIAYQQLTKMSSDEQDVDIESDEDENEAVPQRMVSEENVDKRAHHNALERKRRDHIKDSFNGLKDSIPSMAGNEKMSRASSRAQILKKATEYIQFMRRKNLTHQEDIDDLKRQNSMLEQQIKALEKAKANGPGPLNSQKTNTSDDANLPVD